MNIKNKFLIAGIITFLITGCNVKIGGGNHSSNESGDIGNNGNNNSNNTNNTNDDTHVHTFETTFTVDDNFHWYKSTCEHKDRVSGLERHTFGDWIIEKEASITEKGNRYKICSICDYKFNEEIDMLHSHSFSPVWDFDEASHWHPATCEHYDEISDYAQHSFGDWIIERDSTPTEYGNRYKVCSICEYSLNERIELKENKGLVIENPYTINEALELMKDYSVGDVSDQQYFIIGQVSSATYNSSRDTYSIYLKGYEEDKDTPFQVYSCKIDRDCVDDDYSALGLSNKYIIVRGYLKLYYNERLSKNIFEMSYLSSAESPSGTSSTPLIKYVDDSDINRGHVHTYETNYSYDEKGHWYAASCEHTTLTSSYSTHNFDEWVIDISPTETSKGRKHRNCISCGYRAYQDITIQGTGNGTFTVYSFNDFHGAVNEYPSESHAGLARFGTYLKNVSREANTLIIDSGDTFQGSIESNYNRGRLITDVFNYAHVDVHTLGNHDFDWGEDKIESNKARSNEGDGWRMTNLGANIYDYSFAVKREGNTQQSRLGEKYYIKTLENGLKIGVIGTIGSDQITSICSPLVEDICFKNHVSYIKDLSDELRNEKGCDFVIASVHNSTAGLLEKGLTDVSPISGKRYVDYVVGGHSHADEYNSENGVYFTQAGSYGKMMYKASFTVSSDSVSETNITRVNYSSIKNATSTIDAKIQSLIDTYGEESSEAGNEVILSSANGSFSENVQMPNLLSKAIYETARNHGYNVVMANVNKARYSVSATTWKYSTIYEAFPFDNVVYIVKVKGEKNVKQLCYNANSVYHDPSFTTMNYNDEYLVAIIDYLLWHTDANRNYDYFNHNSGYMEIVGTLRNANGENFLYRDILACYLRGIRTTVNASDYSNTALEHIKPSYN